MANKKSLRKRQLQDLRGLVHSNDFKLLVPVELCCLKGGGFTITATHLSPDEDFVDVFVQSGDFDAINENRAGCCMASDLTAESLARLHQAAWKAAFSGNRIS